MARSSARPAARPQPEEMTFPFQKVLIANRGEIAVRVIRACRDLGLASVAVYSDADRTAPHVLMADEAVHLGAPQASESYLNIGKLLDAARSVGAGAIHPGYGFLSENADFADACEQAGIIFVGPPGRVMREMGEKTAARHVAQSVGVPVVPGFDALEDAAEATRLAEQIGYPIMLKAAAGGGGKGIRIVHKRADLEAALRLARSEALGAFGDSAVYIEKAVMPARHIEVQIIGDTHGHVVHLGERECSVQRRHQKLIEESPSPALDDELRAQITGAAVKLCQAVGYVNAGTCEFLLGPDRGFYFLEVNARLQVEHPVTELCTNIDLVREQFRVAAGLPLSFTQDEIQFRGHAIEARITAEDPLNRFLPASGHITALRDPAGAGVRLDSGVYAGMTIPLFYDSLLAKLICYGADRQEAINRLRRALDEYTIGGVRTTIPFDQWIVRNERFLAGDFSTSFVEEEWHPEQAMAALAIPAGVPGANGEASATSHANGRKSGQQPAAQSDAPAKLVAEGVLDHEQLAALVATLAAQDLGQQRASRRHTSEGENGTQDGSAWRLISRRAAMGSGW